MAQCTRQDAWLSVLAEPQNFLEGRFGLTCVKAHLLASEGFGNDLVKSLESKMAELQ